MTLVSSGSFRIQVCGPLVVERDGERLEATMPGRQGRLLFTYLVLNRHRSVSREELTDAIWPDQPATATETGLNALLSKLRRCLGADSLEGRSVIRLVLHDGWVDLEAATEAIHRAESSVALHDWTRAWGPALVALFIAEREILPGEDLLWIDDVRAQLADVRLRGLDAYALAALGIGGTELAAAARAGRQLVRLAPLRESGYRHLMRALSAQGNGAEALRVYSDLCSTLQAELGVSPSAATRSTYEELLRS